MMNSYDMQFLTAGALIFCVIILSLPFFKAAFAAWQRRKQIPLAEKALPTNKTPERFSTAAAVYLRYLEEDVFPPGTVSDSFLLNVIRREECDALTALRSRLCETVQTKREKNHAPNRLPADGNRHSGKPKEPVAAK